MTTDYATLITSIRTNVDDGAKANATFGEVPKGKRDGVLKIFKLQYENIVTDSVYLTSNTTIRTQTGFTVDELNGLITFTSAPTGSESPWYFDYNWSWLTDTEYTNFIDSATNWLGGTAGQALPSGLNEAIIQYSGYLFWMRRSSEYARRYASTSAVGSQSVETVTQSFRNLANAAYKASVTARDDFYKRQGQRNAPASGTFNYGIDPFTPIR